MSEPVKPSDTAIVEATPQLVDSRDPATGRFGRGNPGGGRRKMPDHVREILEAKTPEAARRLVEALDATKIVHYLGQEVGEYTDHAMRTQAALAIFERLYGKTAQAIVTEDGDGNPTAAVGIVFLPTGPKP